MKTKNIITCTCAALILTILGTISCKKVDNNNSYLNSLPRLALYVPNVPGIGEYNYGTSYVIGDTMTVVGNLFIKRPGTTIHVGNADAQLVKTSTVNYRTASGVEVLDVARFLITDAMGVGANRPVTITANGNSVNAPAIAINTFVPLLSQTDTTLWVDKLGAWMPPIGGGLGSGAEVADINSTDDGTIYFTNINGIYQFAAGQTSVIADKNTVFTDGTTTFKAISFLGGTADKQNKFLYFSMKVAENGVTPTGMNIYRLCKKDLQSGVITTINRTQELTSGTSNVTPFEGLVGQVPISASLFKTDETGQIYFVNKLRNTSSGLFNVKYINNVCRMDVNGNIKSILTLQGSVPAPGVALHTTTMIAYSLDPEGKQLYVVDDTGYNILVYDNTIDNIAYYSGEASTTTYSYVSFDTSTVTGVPSGKQNMQTFSKMQALPNGDLITIGVVNPSLAAFNLSSKKMYAYAGTEKGLFNPSLSNNCAYTGPGQTNDTGPAKYVRFAANFNACMLGGSIFSSVFAGIDPHGALYYCTVNITGSDQTVTFYKMYSKK